MPDATVIQAGMGAILLSCRAHLATTLGIDETLVKLVAKSRVPRFQAEKDVLLWPRGFYYGKDGTDGGRTVARLLRSLWVVPRSRLSLDESDRDDAYLTDADLGFFAWEEAVAKALHGFFPTDADGNHLTTCELRIDDGQGPIRGQDQGLEDWGDSVINFAVDYLLLLNQPGL